MLFGKHLKKYYKKYAFHLIFGVLVLALNDFLQLYIPDLLGKIVGLFVKDYVPDNIIKDVGLISIQIIVISFLVFVFRFLFRFFLFRASTGIGLGLRQEMFEKAERLDVEYYHNTKIGSVMSWITSDTEEIMEYFGWGTVMLVDGVFMTIICIIKMFILDWAMTLFILFPIALIVVWGFLVEKVVSEKWLIRQKAFDEMYEFTEENFYGIRVIKSFLKETQQLIHFSKIARKNEKADVKLGIINTGFDILIEIIIAIVTSLIFGFGGFLVFKTVKGDSFTIFGHSIVLGADKLVTFMTYFTTLIWPLIALGQVITMHSRAKTSLKRISNFMDAEEVIKNKDDAIELDNVKGKIEFRNLSFAYPGKTKNYLENISFVINPGESVGIVGRIGSGKTTILNLISRLYNVEENSILIDDKDIMSCTFESVRNNLAVVPQENFLFSNTIEENIKFGLENVTTDEIIQSAKFSDVEKDIEAFEKKYDTFTGERGFSLSGGQKQRIAISRAFIKDAPIMILDDSVSAVDIKTEETILKNIRELRKGKTTIVVASRISTVNTLDKIIVMNEGKLEAFDTPENLLNKSNTYKKMVYLQRIEDELKEGN